VTVNHSAKLSPWTGLLILAAATACSPKPSNGTSGTPPARGTATMKPTSITRAPFGTTADGKAATLYTLTNATGIQMRVTDYGGVIVSLRVPDRNHQLGDVVLGFDSLTPYTSVSPYFGALIGRYGNRIANGRFTLDGHTYTLAKNDGPNTLHGGTRGFNKYVWSATSFQKPDSVGIVLTRTSPDGEEGFPGNLTATVTYTLTDSDEVIFDYEATTDKPTPVNLTQHSYFNLRDGGASEILGHVVTIDADSFTPVDSTMIPTGEIRSVTGTPFDFRHPTAIGARIGEDNQQLKIGKGYDHNFVLNKNGAQNSGDATPALPLAATVYEPTTGRVMQVYTTEPGLQFYSGNFLDGTLTGKHGVVYKHRSGFAMETQHFPDSPNHPEFPSTILRPGEKYHSRSVYRFSVR
jgi:aldose 1-epimerase